MHGLDAAKPSQTPCKMCFPCMAQKIHDSDVHQCHLPNLLFAVSHDVCSLLHSIKHATEHLPDDRFISISFKGVTMA